MSFDTRWVLAVCALVLAACSSEPTTDSGDAAAVPTTLGQPAPSWSAVDFQPKSSRFGESYGLDQFRGKVLLVGYLSGWCPYCETQAGLLEKMQNELVAEGVADVQIVIVNSADAQKDQGKFVALTSFPLFQDSDDALVFRKSGTSKDDFAVYAKDGTLARFYGPSSTRDLAQESTYAAIKAELVGLR